MTIYDRARDALTKATKGPWFYDGTEAPDGRFIADEPTGEMCMSMQENGWGSYFKTADAELAALAPELAAELVRLHDELTTLADELEETGGMLLTAEPSPQGAVGRGIQMCAARIRAVIERGE